MAVRTILVPLDLSPAGEPVCSCAADLAKALGARLTVLHVVEALEELRGMNLPTISYDELVPDLEEHARQHLDRYVAAHLGEAATVDLRVAHGEAYERILEAARELPASLIVMGVHGRKGLERAIFGSTTERVIRSSPVPVVSVPVPE